MRARPTERPPPARVLGRATDQYKGGSSNSSSTTTTRPRHLSEASMLLRARAEANASRKGMPPGPIGRASHFISTKFGRYLLDLRAPAKSLLRARPLAHVVRYTYGGRGGGAHESLPPRNYDKYFTLLRSGTQTIRTCEVVALEVRTAAAALEAGRQVLRVRRRLAEAVAAGVGSAADVVPPALVVPRWVAPPPHIMQRGKTNKTVHIEPSSLRNLWRLGWLVAEDCTSDVPAPAPGSVPVPVEAAKPAKAKGQLKGAGKKKGADKKVAAAEPPRLQMPFWRLPVLGGDGRYRPYARTVGLAMWTERVKAALYMDRQLEITRGIEDGIHAILAKPTTWVANHELRWTVPTKKKSK